MYISNFVHLIGVRFIHHPELGVQLWSSWIRGVLPVLDLSLVQNSWFKCSTSSPAYHKVLQKSANELSLESDVIKEEK